ncbi:hypothetical protein A3781_19750 [Bacillus badius]|nr:hypothetical protein A3781_19750 [Bacillus badius]
MSNTKKFLSGIQFLSIVYEGRLNGQPFNRNAVKSIVSILIKMGFKHVANEGTLAVLECSKEGLTQTIWIGKSGNESFYRHATSEQMEIAI